MPAGVWLVVLLCSSSEPQAYLLKSESRANNFKLRHHTGSHWVTEDMHKYMFNVGSKKLKKISGASAMLSW
jgi:hypothetical protein